MISRYEELYSHMDIDLPGIVFARPLLLQTLQTIGRDFCQWTEAWRQRISMNIITDQRAYVLNAAYDADIIRPWKVWDNGGGTAEVEETDPVSTGLYDFDPANKTLTFKYDPEAGTAGTAWVTGTVYAIGDERTNGNKTYEALSAHTAAATFAEDFVNGKWEDITDGLIVKVVLVPRLNCTELASWFMEKWAEALINGAKASLMIQPKKTWSDPDRARLFAFEYDRYKALAIREKTTEHKQQNMMVQSRRWA